MTEELKLFIIKHSGDHAPFAPKDVRIEYWLRAFVQEVEQRADIRSSHGGRNAYDIGVSMTHLVRELGLDSDKERP